MALAVILASALSLGCQPGTEDGARAASTTRGDTKAALEVTASQDARFDVLAGIWAVRTVEDKQHGGVVLRLFETGGGDPAMNGDMLVLHIMNFYAHDAGLTFETGINVRAVESVELDAATSSLVVKTNADTANEDGSIGSKSRTFVLTYSVDSKGALGDSLSVQEQGSAPELVTASRDGRWDVLDGIWAVRTVEDGDLGIVLRLFETGGGDPAMNGDMLLLHIMNFNMHDAGLTWETGINVRAVESANLDAAASKLVVKTSVDTADADGNIGSAARTYALTYSVNARGAVDEKISVQQAD
jgi:hypothetical protein